MPLAVDLAAKEHALRSWGMPECLHVPIAAIDEHAIRKYIGEVTQVLSRDKTSRALLVKMENSPVSDPRYPIFRLEESSVFHAEMQVWVDVEYSAYRQAYRRAFPTEDITGKILSHTMNRRLARIMGFQFVRVTEISRSSNSSSGFSENWAVALYSKPEELASFKRRGMFIRYADLTCLMLMLDIKLGGGVMDVVNEGQRLVRPELSE